MRKFFLGVAAGLAVGAATAAGAVSISGSSDYLMGWTVVFDRDVICRDPMVWTDIQRIDCGR